MIPKKRKSYEEIKRISDNLEAIAIIDFIPDEQSTIQKFDDNFKKILGHAISIKSEYYPGVPSDYVDPTSQFDKSKNIPKGIEYIHVICAKHIGVAQEVICYCKINKLEMQKEVEIFYKNYLKSHIASLLRFKKKSGIDYETWDDREKWNNETYTVLTSFFERYEIDQSHFKMYFKELEHIVDNPSIELDSSILTNGFLNSKLNFLENLQFEVEKYYKDCIPGIFLESLKTNSHGNCISAYIYDISRLDYPIVKDAQNETANIDKVYQWIGMFDYNNKILHSKYDGNHLNLIGLDNKHSENQFLSLIGHNFIMGYGSQYNFSRLGIYKKRFIIFSLMEEINMDYSVKIGYTEVLTNLSKFLLPTHWLRFRLEELGGLEELEKLNSKKQEIPVIRHDKSTNEVSKDLEEMFNIYDSENANKTNSIDFLVKIQDELSCFNSLKTEMSSFISETIEKSPKSLSKALYRDMDIWLEMTHKKIQDLANKQDLRFQHIQNNINVTSSFINNKLQISIKNLTLLVAGLTIILIVLALIPLLKEIMKFIINWIIN